MAIQQYSYPGGPEGYLHSDVPYSDVSYSDVPLSLKVSLKDLVDQFSLSGSCILQFCPRSRQVTRLRRWLKPTHHPTSNQAVLARIELSIDWDTISEIPLFEIHLIEKSFYSVNPFHLYSCLYHKNSDRIHCLLFWSSEPISKHQRYGISLYAQVLKQQSITEPVPFLQELDQRLSYIRHQLGTPLALTLLYIDLLKNTAQSPKDQEWLEALQSTAEEMGLSLSRLTEVETSPETTWINGDLARLVEQCFQELRPWMQEKHLTWVGHLPPLHLSLDAWKIKQALLNLLSNAIAFSPPGGKIVCEGHSLATEVILTLGDQGPGLSTDDLDSMWNPFYSHRSGGMGMGLTITKQIIVEHQGQIWAENRPEGGAQFFIRLPRNL